MSKKNKFFADDGCEFIAKGANGAVYRYDNETTVNHYRTKLVEVLDKVDTLVF